MENSYRGDELDKVEMFETIKEIMIDFLRGYPAHVYWGIIESRFEGNLGEIVRDKLEGDGLIEIDKARLSQKLYRLTPEGVYFAVSLSNLDYSEKIAEYSKEISNYEKRVLKYNQEVLRHTRETQEFNRRIIHLTRLLIVIGSMALIVGIIPILPNIINALKNWLALN